MACLIWNRARFEVITAILKIQILWNVTPCRLLREGVTLHTTWVSRCLYSCFNIILIKARALPVTKPRKKKTQLALFSQRNFVQRLITIWCTLVPALIGNLAASYFVYDRISRAKYISQSNAMAVTKERHWKRWHQKLGNCHHYVKKIYNFNIILLLLWRSLQIKKSSSVRHWPNIRT